MVDLPAPFSPSRARTSSARISRSASSNATVGPQPTVKRLMPNGGQARAPAGSKRRRKRPALKPARAWRIVRWGNRERNKSTRISSRSARPDRPVHTRYFVVYRRWIPRHWSPAASELCGPENGRVIGGHILVIHCGSFASYQSAICAPVQNFTSRF